MGPKPQSQTNQFRFPFPDTNPQVRKESKMAEKRKGLSITKKFKAVARPNPGNTTAQLSQESIPVNPESQQPPNSESNPPPLEDAPAHTGTPWPGAGKMSGNLFEIRKDWPVPPSINTSTNITTKPNPPTISAEPQDPNQSKPSSTATKLEGYGWGTNCSICKKAEEDWDGEHQKHLQQSDVQHPKCETQSRSRTPNTTRTIKYQKVSTPKYPLMCLTDMQNKYA